VSHRPGHRLFWRVYMHGLLLLLLVAVTVAAVAWALRGDRPGHLPGGRAAAYAAARAAELSGDPRRLAAELATVEEAFGLQASVWDARGGLVASTASPPLDPALAPGPLAPGDPPARLRHRSFGWAVRLANGGLLLTAAPAHDPTRGLAIIGAVLAALALGSIPLAHSITSPVERVTAAARRLGAGDLSARAGVRAHGEVGELGRSFDEMAERLERLVRSEQELLANVSHELRTPLARIRVALALAAEGDAERARRHLEGMDADLSELDRLVEDVLATARLDLASATSGFHVARAPVDVPALLGDVARRFAAAHPGRELAVDAAPALPAIHGDAPLLRRLLANLLDNAAKYSEPSAPVALAARSDGGALLLEVRDSGIGIDAADLPRLFTPFFRTDRSRARGTGGVGLGLALARRIVEGHGGSIEVESAPGVGTTVRVKLPGAGPR
jgi:two-component system OmpR family sensor kinase